VPRPTVRRPKTKLVRTIPIGNTELSTSSVSSELQDYVDVLLGRKHPPADFGELTLQELASAYYSRALEIEMHIHRAEREGVVGRGTPFYKLRTGELRSFIELAKNACELGSRRVTMLQIESEMREG
jgi:hypothetical protein